MTLAEIILTATTCGEACWSAREDVCRCSCGGVNHGCTRAEDGERPARTSKIKGQVYQLVAVGLYRRMEGVKRAVEDYCREHDIGMRTLAGGYRYLGDDVAIRKAGTASQVERWPELALARSTQETEAPINVPRDLLWVRADLVDAVAQPDTIEAYGAEHDEQVAQWDAEREAQRAKYRLEGGQE